MLKGIVKLSRIEAYVASRKTEFDGKFRTLELVEALDPVACAAVDALAGRIAQVAIRRIETRWQEIYATVDEAAFPRRVELPAVWRGNGAALSVAGLIGSAGEIIV